MTFENRFIVLQWNLPLVLQAVNCNYELLRGNYRSTLSYSFNSEIIILHIFIYAFIFIFMCDVEAKAINTLTLNARFCPLPVTMEMGFFL